MVRVGLADSAGVRVALLVVLCVGGALAMGVGSGTAAETGNETLVVDDDGDAEYASIQDAVEDASDGDTVEVRPGTYGGTVVVDRNVSIVAPDGATMNGTTAHPYKAAFQIVVSSDAAPTIRGFTIFGYNIGIGGAQGDAAWVIADLHISDIGHAGVFASGAAGDWRARNVTTVGGKHGFDAYETTGDWRIRGSEIRDANSNGVFAEDSAGDWTVSDVTIGTDAPGVSASNSRGNWTVQGSRITGNLGPGIHAENTSGAWRVVDTTVRDGDDAGVLAFESGGNWRIENATFEENDAGAVSATSTTGNWTVANSTFGPGQFFAVTAFASTGDWTIAGTTIRNRTGVGVFAERAGGDWTVRNATIGDLRTQTTAELPSEGVGVFANATTGAWRVDNSTLTDTERPAINATDARIEGNATGNWWGDADGPGPDDCVGNVTCADPLSAPPGDAGGGTVADYTDGDGVVDSGGLRTAVDDWRTGATDTGLLRDVIDHWRSGEPVG